LKQHNRSRKHSEFVDPEFAEALYGDDSRKLSSERQAQRKTQQFCRQVQRALNLALADGSAGDGINVSPGPDCGHLMVHIVAPADRPVLDAIEALRRAAPRLRSEVAQAISRKRAPELSFVPAFPSAGPAEEHDGGDHE